MPINVALIIDKILITSDDKTNEEAIIDKINIVVIDINTEIIFIIFILFFNFLIFCEH